MMVRRDALARRRRLDEGFYMYLEDVDLCRRLRDRGLGDRVLPARRARASRELLDRAVPARRVYQHARSRGIYARKHHGRAGERAVQALTAATFLARAGLARVLPGVRRRRRRPLPRARPRFARPYAEPAIEEAAAEHNAARRRERPRARHGRPGLHRLGVRARARGRRRSRC